MVTTTQEQPTQSFTPKTVSVMGAGEEIRNIETLRRFHTPTSSDGGTRDYHSHANLTPHYVFAKTVLNYAEANGLDIDDVAFKVDGVEEETIEVVNLFGFIKKQPVTIAKRFFLIARIKNPEYKLADDVDTFIIARNSHDKRLCMEVAIGNKVIVCSNLMFGGDIAIKSKNSKFGYEHLEERLQELFTDYLVKANDMRYDIEAFKHTIITEAEGLAFIGHNASNGEFIQPSRTPAVCDMFIKPEHPESYQDALGYEKYTVWRLLNAYTYVHRGELVINPETNEPYPDQRRTQVCPLELKKKFTKALWARLRTVSGVGKWYK